MTLGRLLVHIERVLTFPRSMDFHCNWYGELVRKRRLLSAVIIPHRGAVSNDLCLGGLERPVHRLDRYQVPLSQNLFRVVTFAPLLFPQLLLGVVMLLVVLVLGNWLNFSTAW